MNKLQKLQYIAKHFTLLYVDDNITLLDKAATLLRKFFHQVDIAKNGEIALEKFKQTPYPLLITDIKMPKMDGIAFIKEIKKIAPETKVIVISAFDDKEFLRQGIELGIFRFLTKPVDVNELVETLLEVLLEIQEKEKKELFQTQLQHMINYQSSMVLMLHNEKPVMANKIFLDFFEIEAIEEFEKKYGDICSQFLHKDNECLEELQSNEQKLFQVQLKNSKKEERDFLLKYQNINENENYAILSFDDITQLNLSNPTIKTEQKEESFDEGDDLIFNLMHAIYRNNAKIEVCNFYKGLNITNDASITAIKDPTLTIKTSYTQQTAMQNEQRCYLCSNALPYVVESQEISHIDFKKQSVLLNELHFVKESPIDRKTVRVEPQEASSATLSLNDHTYNEGITIVDISINALKLQLQTLPAGLEKDAALQLQLQLKTQQEDLTLQADATLYTKKEMQDCFYIVCIFTNIDKHKLIKYITKRQIAIIREFKGLQNAKQ